MTVVEFPTELDVVVRRHFNAAIDLVFDVFTKPEHVQRTFATFGEEFPVCDIDLRVGGSYHYVLIPPNGTACSFRGTFLEVERPTRTVATWLFEGWPDADAVETLELASTSDGTEARWTLSFRDQAGRNRMTRTDGPQANFESIAAYLVTLVSE